MSPLLGLFLLPLVFSQTCQENQDSGPCGIGGSCDVNQTCITTVKPFVCCPDAEIISASTLKPTLSPGSQTTASTCVDLKNPSTGTSDCPKVAYLCKDPVYYNVMKVQCPKTCNLCSTTSSSSSTCQDKPNVNGGATDCPQKAYLCQASGYVDFMKEQCPKTCGYCS